MDFWFFLALIPVFGFGCVCGFATEYFLEHFDFKDFKHNYKWGG